MNSLSLFTFPCLQYAANDPLTAQCLDDIKTLFWFEKLINTSFIPDNVVEENNKQILTKRPKLVVAWKG